MSFDVERIHKSAGRVNNFLRKNSKRPTSAAIHNLRTSTRRLETTFTSIGLDSKRKVKRLLRRLKDVRSRAGKVRDMDVLTADALAIKHDGEEDCLVQLLEFLGAERNKYARKLRLLIAASGPRLRRNLKRGRKRVEKLFTEAHNNPTASDAMPAAMARAMELSSELNNPTRLNRSNLHSYRLKVKELRNVLQLSNQSDEQEFVEKLGEVKDAIGEWHDWEELIAIATRVLDHSGSCNLVKQMRATSSSKYNRALSLANSLRSQYLKSGNTKRRARDTKRTALSLPVLRATSAIAER